MQKLFVTPLASLLMLTFDGQVAHMMQKFFANSGINHALKEGTIPKRSRFLLPGRDAVPLLLLADPACPLLPLCMKEYSSCYTNKQVIFNQMLRSARNKVECAFGRLKARWQVLKTPINQRK